MEDTKLIYNNRVCVLREMFRVLASVDNSKRMFAAADLDWARHERHGRGRLYPFERLRVGNVERLVDGLAGRAVCGDDVE